MSSAKNIVFGSSLVLIEVKKLGGLKLCITNQASFNLPIQLLGCVGGRKNSEDKIVTKVL